MTTKQETIIVFKLRGRDPRPLEEWCNNKGYHLFIVEDPDEFSEIVDERVISTIIVPLESIETGYENALEFATIAYDKLKPEDSDINIVYSTEDITPINWQLLDPRIIRDIPITPPSVEYVDKEWSNTIKEIDRLIITKRERHPRNLNGTPVEIEIENEEDVSMTIPIEVKLLIRSAFKDMNKVLIKVPKQGLSGSIVLEIQPYDKNRRMEKKFAKIYHQEDKAYEEWLRFRDHIDGYFDPNYYPHYDNLRRCKGLAHSIFITELISGPNQVTATLNNMIQETEYSVVDVLKIIDKVLSILHEKWGSDLELLGSTLLESYLGSIIKNEDLSNKLLSEIICHRWLGFSGHIEDKCSKIDTILKNLKIENPVGKICHGDLHTENIIIKKEEQSLAPVFIDFSKTNLHHQVLDHVTLEADILVKSLETVIKDEDITHIIDLTDRILTSSNIADNDIDILVKDEISQVQKAISLIHRIRKHAHQEYKLVKNEYVLGLFLKILKMISYRDILPHQYKRATKYMDYLIGKLK